MSRSKKKHPIRGITSASSEKEDKKMWHRAFRRKNTQLLLSEKQKSPDAAEAPFPIPKEMSDPWKMDKDGKVWDSEPGADRK